MPSLPETSRLRRELGPMLRLATPAVLAELSWMAMGTMDTLMVGRLGPESIGAVGLGSVLFLVPAIFAIGVLLALDTLVAQAFGAGRLDECHRWLFQGCALSVLLCLPLSAIVAFAFPAALASWGVDPAVAPLTVGYLETVNWSLLPLLLYTTFRRYLQAMDRAAPVAWALVTANLVDLVGNWALIFGRLGLPALGVQGAAWSTVIARVYMMGFLLVAIVAGERRRRSGLAHVAARPDPPRLRLLFALGLPAALQLTLEVGVFGAATTLASRLSPAALAAHQIAITIVSVTFMVPLGVSSAAAVRVGQAIGRGDGAGAATSGWTAIAFGAGFMTLAGLALVLGPRLLVGAFTGDAAVTAAGIRLLQVAAAFQLFDGLQVVSTGALRGLGDTRTPMLANLVGHWLVGLPLGSTLCFAAALGVVGLWVGLSAGLIGVGAFLLLVWAGRARRLMQGAAGPAVVGVEEKAG